MSAEDNIKFELCMLCILQSGERYELLQRVQNLHHFGHFAVAAYGWRGALMSRLFRSTLQKHEWTRFKSVAGNAMGKEETFFTKLTGIQTEDILYECKHQPTYGVPKHWLVVDHSKQALVLAIRGTTTAADALTDVVSRNKTFIGDTKAHEGIAVSAEGLYASLFSSEGLYLQKWLKKFKGYDFVTCGHSLGGGVAILLCGLIHHFRTLHVNALGEEQAQEVPFYGVNVYCYAYGPPPVIWPASNFPPDATRNTFVFINGEDCVPRLSLRSVRDLVKLLRLLCESSTPEQSTEGITSMVEHFPRVLTPSVLNEPGYLSTSSDKGDHFNSSLIAQNDEAEEDVDKYPLEIPGRLLYMKLSLPLPVSMDNEEQLMEMTTNAQASSSGYRQVFSEYWEHHQETINHTFESVSSWFKSISKGMSREGADNIPVENTSESHSQSSHGRHEYSETNSDASARASDDSVPTRGDRISSLRLSKGTEGLSLGRDVSKFLSDRSHFKFAWLSEPSSADFPEIIVRTCSIQEHMPFSYLGVLLELEHIIQKACSL